MPIPAGLRILSDADEGTALSGHTAIYRVPANPRGQATHRLGWANLREFLLGPIGHQRALDAGGGSGILALRLASLGFDVELLDDSEAMLSVAKQEAEANAPRGHISFVCADVHSVELFEPASFDLVVCHNLLEYTEDRLSVLRSLVQLLSNGGKCSLLVRNRYGEVLKKAIKTRDFELAKTALYAETVLDSLYGFSTREARRHD